MTVQLSTLANGMRIVTHRMPHVETASLGVFVGVGARAETDSEHGVAHFLEHMAFKGTLTRSATQLAEEIESSGGALNAVTSSEATNYVARVLKEDVSLGIELIADILLNPAFDEEEFDKEREVILQEIAAAQDSPDDIVFDLALLEAYPHHPLGRSILGTERTVERIDPPHLKRFRLENYATTRMILAAAGAVDHDTIHKQAEALFSTLTSEPSRELRRASFGGGHAVSDRRFEQCHVVYAFEGYANHADEAFASRIFSTIAGGGMSSRLFQEVREKRGLCYDIHAFDWGYTDTGLVGFHAATSPNQLKELSQIALRIFADLAENGPEASELRRAKAQMKAGLFMSLESCEARAGQLAWDMMVFKRPLDTDEIVSRIEDVTADRVQKVAQAMQAQRAVVTAVVGAKGAAGAAADAAEAFQSGALALV
jgi:predicted Zn-dependent peptidase